MMSSASRPGAWSHAFWAASFGPSFRGYSAHHSWNSGSHSPLGFRRARGFVGRSTTVSFVGGRGVVFFYFYFYFSSTVA
jgi:hypothetical protein